MIYMIYSPNERSLAEAVVEKLSTKHRYLFAPAGLVAESQQWKQEVIEQLKECSVAIALITKESINNQSFLWRCSEAIKMNIRLLPILIAESQSDVIAIRSHSDETDFINLQLWNVILYDIKRDKSESLESKVRSLFYSESSTFANITHVLESWLPIAGVCFLSYSRKDTDFTIKLTADLREAKLKTWRDAENIPAGANWDREIEKAVKECTHLILIASPSSVESENVMDEVSLAINKEKTVIPVMIETCELPMRVHRAQWVDFREGYDQGLKKLLEQLGVKKSE